LIAVDPQSFASGFDSVPEISSSRETTLHFEDANPANIGTVGTPNVVAAPVLSMLQTDTVALRCILKCAWILRVPNAASWINASMAW
jgi:hypothetical protein